MFPASWDRKERVFVAATAICLAIIIASTISSFFLGNLPGWEDQLPFLGMFGPMFVIIGFCFWLDKED